VPELGEQKNAKNGRMKHEDKTYYPRIRKISSKFSNPYMTGAMLKISSAENVFQNYDN
jgi:hypothetical protein